MRKLDLPFSRAPVLRAQKSDSAPLKEAKAEALTVGLRMAPRWRMAGRRAGNSVLCGRKALAQGCFQGLHFSLYPRSDVSVPAAAHSQLHALLRGVRVR